MTSKATIIRPDEMLVKDRGNGARTVQLVTRKTGSTSVINGITEFDPGAKIALHKHNCEESVMVIEGEAVVEIDGEYHRMRTGDTTWVPADVPHRFLNESDAKMRIFWTYATVDATRTTISSGEVRRIDAEEA